MQNIFADTHKICMDAIVQSRKQKNEMH